MSAAKISIKPNNHRIYQCPNNKKLELLTKIIEQNSDEDILIVCSREVEALVENLNNTTVKVVEDRELVKEKELRSSFLISYDMPIEAIVYMERISRADNKACMLLDESEQKALHSIEMLLGRAIKQEIMEGFEYPKKAEKLSDRPTRKKLSKEEIQEIAKKRYESSTREKPKFDSEKDSRDGDKRVKRDFKSDGKKDDKWAKKRPAPKTTGKKISIKARKEKKED
jgi:superfamily II DNA/RNA helicase